MQALRYTATCETSHTASEVLANFEKQADFLAGRILPGNVVEAFHDATGLDGSLLPEGCEIVEVCEKFQQALGFREVSFS